METFFIRALQLILALTILVVLHEFGHFFFARLFKVRVDKFYVFFHPQRSLVRWKKINGKWQVKFFAANVPNNERERKDTDGYVIKNEKGKPKMEQIPLDELDETDWRKYPESTEWGIGWLPFGGYCKIAGMVDESMDKTSMLAPPQTWEFRSQKIWKRFLIVSGGVLVNFLLALVIYAAALFIWGKEYLPLENAKYGFNYSQTLLDAGFQNSDKIMKVGGETVNLQADVAEKLIIEGKRDVIVERNDSTFELIMPTDFAQKFLAAGEKQLLSVRFPFVIADVAKGSAAEKANLQKGDSLVGINKSEVFIFQDIADGFANNKSQEIDLYFYRKGALDSTKVTVSAEGKIGVAVKSFTELLPTKTEKYGFFAAIPEGIKFGWETLASYVKQFKLVFTKEGVKQMGGFGTIGSLFPPVWDWQTFWSMAAFLSIILAFMNFLPIPGLDGGYVLFLLYEAITGKKPSEKFMETAVTIGFALLIALVIYVNGNDIFRFLK